MVKAPYFIAGSTGSIPSQGTKIKQAVRHSQKKKVLEILVKTIKKRKKK